MTVRAAMMTAVLLALLLVAAPAEAKLRWHGCPEADGVRCARLQVPLDHSGAVPGKVDLRVARVAFSKGDDTMMYLSGGPGGAGSFEVATMIKHGLNAERDVIFVD